MSTSSTLAKLTGALVAAAGLAWTGAAWAEPNYGPGYTAFDAEVGPATELSIDLRGEVSARCELNAPDSLDRIRLNEAGETSSDFAIDCNTPFLLSVRSANGGLAAVDPRFGIAERTDYSLGVEVGTDQGRQDLGWCLSAELAPGASAGCAFGAAAPDGGWSSGEATAINQTGALRLRWDGQDAADLPRLGIYQDNIIIEVEVRS
jgi:hypothetical protein